MAENEQRKPSSPRRKSRTRIRAVLAPRLLAQLDAEAHRLCINRDAALSVILASHFSQASCPRATGPQFANCHIHHAQFVISRTGAGNVGQHFHRTDHNQIISGTHNKGKLTTKRSHR